MTSNIEINSNNQIIYYLLIFIKITQISSVNEKHQEIEHIEYLIKLGIRVAQLRKERKLTQDVLADLCGWEAANLRKIEGAKTNPTVKSLLILCEGLGVELKDLLDF